MRLIIIFIFLIISSCGSINRTQQTGKRINLTDLGDRINVSGEYSGTLSINLGFFEEAIYLDDQSRIISTSRKIDNIVDIWDPRGIPMGRLVIFGDQMIASDLTGSHSYQFEKIYSGSTYLVKEDNKKVGIIRFNDESKISIVIYEDINPHLLIHSVYYLP